jgi:long-chain acyl-CoA synthetase
MLYERWQKTVRERRHEIALYDLTSARNWTFDELSRAAETPWPAAGATVYPQGHSAEFILTVLRGWRGNALVFPLDTEPPHPAVPAPPPPCCHLKTTSATTSAPRTIAFTAEQLAADADNIVATMGLRPDWPNLGVISLAHSYGFSNLVLPLLLHGIPLILAPSSLPEAVRRASAGASALTLAAVPALWRAWHEAGAIPRNTRLAISAGAPLPLALEQAVFNSAGLKIHNFYGSSECGGIAYDHTDRPRDDDACVGTPMHTVELRLDKEHCLQVLGRAVGQTYWPHAEPSLRAGCFQTSDLAELKDGQVYLRGRVSDQINVAGRKVSPVTIEQALRAHAAVADCLVFGVPSGHADRTDLIVACVKAKPHGTAAELKQHLLQHLPSWQVPRQWCFVESLETNARGKVSRAQWRKDFLEMRAQRMERNSSGNGD